MASRAHEIGFVPKLQSSGIGSGIVTVRVMTSPAAHLPFLEALRTFEGLHHEGCLPEASVFVKTPAGELAKRNVYMVGEEISRAGIIQFPSRARLADRRLFVALRANRDIVTISDLVEIDGWIQRPLGVKLVLRHLDGVLSRRTVTHLAANSCSLNSGPFGAKPSPVAFFNWLV